MLRRWRLWLRARMTLGWALMLHVLSAPFAGRKKGPARWLGQLALESLGPTPPDNWQHAQPSSRCIGCGLCDMFASPDLIRPSQVIMGGARLPADAPTTSQQTIEALKKVAPDVLRVCPTGVDTTAVAALIENNARAILAAAEQRLTLPG